MFSFLFFKFLNTFIKTSHITQYNNTYNNYIHIYFTSINLIKMDFLFSLVIAYFVIFGVNYFVHLNLCSPLYCSFENVSQNTTQALAFAKASLLTTMMMMMMISLSHSLWCWLVVLSVCCSSSSRNTVINF